MRPTNGRSAAAARSLPYHRPDAGGGPTPDPTAAGQETLYATGRQPQPLARAGLPVRAPTVNRDRGCDEGDGGYLDCEIGGMVACGCLVDEHPENPGQSNGTYRGGDQNEPCEN